MNEMLPQKLDSLKQTAEKHGATLVPYPPLNSQLIFIGGSNRKRVLNAELEEMSAEQFQVLLVGLANPPITEIKSSPIIEWFRSQRMARSPITGHFRGGER